MADPSYPTPEQLEKLRAEIAREREQAETLMRQRLNWAVQEEFWQNETRLSRARNYIAVAAISATVMAASLGALGLIFGRLLP
jgi:hypothetical protein